MRHVDDVAPFLRDIGEALPYFFLRQRDSSELRVHLLVHDASGVTISRRYCPKDVVHEIHDSSLRRDLLRPRHDRVDDRMERLVEFGNIER